MPCYKAKKYKWCKDLPTIFESMTTDEEGPKLYCIFHAPQGRKGKKLEEFNELVFKRIYEAKRENKSCDLSGTIFEGNISFSLFHEDKPLPPINFKESKFYGIADFSDATFSGKANFSNTIFISRASFLRAIFNEEVDFSNAEFKEEANFSDAIFKGKEATLLGINFSSSKFYRKADFYRVKFEEDADFSNAEFNEKALFSETLFNKKAIFFMATFNEEARFGKSAFIRPLFKKLEEIETFIKEGGNFSGLNIKDKVIFEGLNLKNVSFLDTDLKRVDFINCTWHEKNGRKILYDEIKLFKEKKDKDFKNKIKKVEILYRKLKQKYKEEHNEPEVSNWHYGEKEMQRKSSLFRRYFPLSFFNLYWLSSGYGERPLRAGIVLILLILIMSALFGLTGLKPNDGCVIKIKEWNDILNSDYLKATLQYATFDPKPDFMPVNGFLKIVAKLLIPLQAALFALAVRNRFRR
jgi:uncharacterized protein YjbI with pentapeptide repeats